MTDIPGIKQPELNALPQIGDRMTFIYVEHAVINRREGAITVKTVSFIFQQLLFLY